MLNKSIARAACLLLSSVALPASASLSDLVCVECTLEEANFTIINPNGTTASSPLTYPGIGGDFSAEFFGFDLVAHDVNFYWGAGTYTFDSEGDSVAPPRNISMTVNPGQVGLHFLFDWHNSTDIDVLAVLDIVQSPGKIVYTPTDVDGNGITGFAMVDGPFQGIDASVDFEVAVPVPAAAWLFATGLLGLAGVARKK